MSNTQELDNIVLNVKTEQYKELNTTFKLFQYIMNACAAFNIVQGIEQGNILKDSEMLTEWTQGRGIVVPFTLLHFYIPQFIPALFDRVYYPMMNKKYEPEKKPGYIGVLSVEEKNAFYFSGNSFRDNHIIELVHGGGKWNSFTAQQKKVFLFDDKKYRESVKMYSRRMLDYSIERNKKWNSDATLFPQAQELASFYKADISI